MARATVTVKAQRETDGEIDPPQHLTKAERAEWYASRATDVAVVESLAPKVPTLRALESIVEKNALQGAGLWRKAADALVLIRTHKLWKKAKDGNGVAYKSFVVYAEERFGFKKTYAYDLVKAATAKPEALTEGSARAELQSERPVKVLADWQLADRIFKAYTRFEDKATALRDRSDNQEFQTASDNMVSKTYMAVLVLRDAYPEPIEGEAVVIESDAPE